MFQELGAGNEKFKIYKCQKEQENWGNSENSHFKSTFYNTGMVLNTL